MAGFGEISGRDVDPAYPFGKPVIHGEKPEKRLSEHFLDAVEESEKARRNGVSAVPTLSTHAKVLEEFETNLHAHLVRLTEIANALAGQDIHGKPANPVSPAKPEAVKCNLLQHLAERMGRIERLGRQCVRQADRIGAAI
jgi:hypothetical protein